MTRQYDVIVIGSGPNGLAIGAYLSRAGQRVLLLEKRFEAGGGLATEQVTLPDFYHNTHAIYKMMVDYAPVYRDFGFEERYGVEHIQPELQVAMPLEDGRSLCIHRDLERSCESIAAFSKPTFGRVHSITFTSPTVPSVLTVISTSTLPV